MINYRKLHIIAILLLFCFALIMPAYLCAEETKEIEGKAISNQSTSNNISSPISKDSSTYKILVGLSVISVIIILIALRNIILSIFAYLFVISSFIWTGYSVTLLFGRKDLELLDFASLGSGILLIIISCVVLHLVNGNPTGSSMKSSSSDSVSSSKSEYDLLLKRAKVAFITMKNEVSRGKLDKTSVFTSDELYEQLSISLDAMKAEKYQLCFDDLRVKKITVKKKVVENHMNNLYVEVIASATRYKTDLENKNIIEGSQANGDFTEILCFSRKAGCNVAKKGLIEGVCPRCGNPIKGKRTDTCSKCKNELRSGEFDVILTGISYPD
ncbi:MAG: hypothetical protein II567_16200 [Candidatus Riflebacteria bacterium]|nr:hypothetical protein [Candidatus Riflebacteria bacterium]